MTIKNYTRKLEYLKKKYYKFNLGWTKYNIAKITPQTNHNICTNPDLATSYPKIIPSRAMFAFFPNMISVDGLTKKYSYL